MPVQELKMTRLVAPIFALVALCVLSACATAHKEGADSEMPLSMAAVDPCSRGKAAVNGARVGVDSGVAVTKKAFKDCGDGDLLTCVIAPVVPFLALPTGLFLAPVLGGAELVSPPNQR